MTTDAPPPPADEAGGEGASEASAKHPGGRPSKLTPEVVEKVREGLRVGLSPELACERAGINRATFYRWKKLGEEQPDGPYGEFCDTVTCALADFAFDAAKFLWDTRTEPSKDLSAENVRFVLERRFQKDFTRPASIELTGKDGGAIQVQTLEDAIALHGAARTDDKPGP